MESETFFKDLMTVVYDQNLNIKEVINPQKGLLLNYDDNELIGKNVKDLDKLSKSTDQYSIRQVIDNVVNSYKHKRTYFKYHVPTEDGNAVDVICMAEKHNDGKAAFKDYLLDSTFFSSTIGLSVSHINSSSEKRNILMNSTLNQLYDCDDISSSPNWNEDDEYQTDMLAVDNGMHTSNKRIYDMSGAITKWIMTTKKSVKCNNGHFVIATTTDVSSLCDNKSLIGELMLYSSLYNSIPICVAFYDISGVLRSANSQYLELFHLEKSKIVNKQNIHDDINIPQWAFEKICNDEQVSFNNIYEITSPSNGRKQVHLLSVSIVPIKNVTGNIIGYSQLFDDITERNIDKHLLDIIYQNIPLGMILYDKDGNLLNVNDKNREIMGIDKSTPLNNINLFKEPNLTAEQIEKLRDGQDVSFDLDYNFKMLNGYFETINSSIKKLHISITVIRNNGKLDGYLLLNQDLTETKAYEELLKDRNVKLNIAVENGGLVIWEYNCDTGKFMPYNRFNNDCIFLGRDFQDYGKIITNDTYNSFLNVYDIMTGRKNKEFTEHACFISPKDGSHIYMTIFGKPYKRNIKGEIASYIGYRKDTTKDVMLMKNLEYSSRKNKLILDNIGTGLAYIDKDYNIVWKNSLFDEFYEINSFDEVYIHPTCYDAVYQKRTTCVSRIVEKIMHTKKIEVEHNVKNSHDVYDLIGSPVIGDNNEVCGVVARFCKVSDVYRATKELESVSRMLQSIIDNLPFGLYIKDIDDNYRYLIANQNICTMSHLEHNDSIGKTDYDIFNKETADLFRKEDLEVIQKFNETHRPVILRKRLTVNGKEIFVKTTSIVFKHENDKHYLISASIDITEKEMMIKELKEAKEKAEESDKLKSTFLANMSHEIRTPLNAIIGFSEIIASESDVENNNQYTKIIQHNNKVLLRLINDILDLSKMDAGVVKLQNKKFDLSELNNVFTAFCESNKRENDVEFISDFPYKKCIVNLDEQRFIQVFNNFITNAIKYTDSGYIKYGYTHEDNGIKIYVKDTGTGISEADKSKMFTRFTKLDDNVQGNGLGLTICKTIMDMQNGKIGFDSKAGEGSTFWAWFPTSADIER